MVSLLAPIPRIGFRASAVQPGCCTERTVGNNMAEPPSNASCPGRTRSIGLQHYTSRATIICLAELCVSSPVRGRVKTMLVRFRLVVPRILDPSPFSARWPIKWRHLQSVLFDPPRLQSICSFFINLFLLYSFSILLEALILLDHYRGNGAACVSGIE
jgi:hypothetical protein